ncbi:MAG TPA: energy transducer TonB [Chitinophagaceae bacterium]|nr:energy transducer TonB [Chitinophagaceae bacterium]
MTSNEISHADVLDILFENRNKMYGAYALRKHYHQRLGFALALCLSTVFLLLLFLVNKHERENSPPLHIDDVVRLIEIPKEPLPQVLEQQRPQPRSRAATTRHTNNIQISPDETTVAEQAELNVTAIGIENSDGTRSMELQAAPPESSGTTDAQPTIAKDEQRFVAVEKSAEFPGGESAWLAFLNRHLRTPEELQPGERRTVLVRFTVSPEGNISDFQVLQSGGKIFDNEVIRVLKKMPRWKPAVQNGKAIPVLFTQPVSFMAFEE